MNTAADTAKVIRQQITMGALMSLGARDFSHGTRDGQTYLAFAATVLPFTKSGNRATAARAMTVTVTLTPADLYDITVTYPQRGDRYGLKTPETHYTAEGIYADQLPRLLLALDYDGETVLNPRYL